MMELEDVVGWAVTRADSASVRFDVAKVQSFDGTHVTLFIRGKAIPRIPVLHSYIVSPPAAGDVVLFVVTQRGKIIVLGKIGK